MKIYTVILVILILILIYITLNSSELFTDDDVLNQIDHNMPKDFQGFDRDSVNGFFDIQKDDDLLTK
jgi:hypothetical protein